jgi:hypothetical protein
VAAQRWGQQGTPGPKTCHKTNLRGRATTLLQLDKKWKEERLGHAEEETCDVRRPKGSEDPRGLDSLRGEVDDPAPAFGCAELSQCIWLSVECRTRRDTVVGKDRLRLLDAQRHNGRNKGSVDSAGHPGLT